MKNRIFIFIGFFIPFVVFTQTVNTVLAGVSNKFTAKQSIQFTTRYNLYKDAKSNIITQSYPGIFMKNSNNQLYMKINNTEFLNTSKYTVKINHEEKAMIISKNQKFSMGDFDIKKLLVLCTINSFKDKNNCWEIMLSSKQYTDLQYSKVILFINKDFTLKKQVFYYNTQLNFAQDYKKQDLSNPRLEIVYSNYNNNEVSSLNFNTDNFFTITKANKIVPSVVYKNYQIDDMRNTINNKKLK